MNKYIDLNALNQAFRLQKEYVDKNNLLVKGSGVNSIVKKGAQSAFATGKNSIAIGNRAYAEENNSIAIGDNTNAFGDNCLALCGDLLKIYVTGKVSEIETYGYTATYAEMYDYNIYYNTYLEETFLGCYICNSDKVPITKVNNLFSIDNAFKLFTDEPLSIVDLNHAEFYIMSNCSAGTNSLAIGQSKTVGINSVAINESKVYNDYAFTEGRSTCYAAFGHAEGLYRNINGFAGHIEGSSISYVKIYKGETSGEYFIKDFSKDYIDKLSSFKVVCQNNVYDVLSAKIKNDLFYFTLNDELPTNKRYYLFIDHFSDGEACHAEGVSTIAKGDGSHAEGLYTITEGRSSHAEGNSCITYGSNSHAEGKGTYTTNDNEHAQGQYNLSNTGITLHSIGIGTMGTPKNAEETSFNGDKYIIGIGGYDGTNLTTSRSLQTVINSKQDAITIDTVLSNTSTNLVQNKVVSTAISNLTSRVNVLETNYVTEQEVITMFNSLTI